jgi:GTP:adenosylcobinamide-phosphate guanylyltransferase
MKRKLEAVIVCINYSDFLSHTLPTNKSLFDKTVIVTDTQDKETKKVCEKWGVMCIQTDAFYENDLHIPNKSKGINEGLKYLDKDGWVVQLDADIWLPPFFRRFIENMELDETCIYGMDRMMINSYKKWYKFQHVDKKIIHEGWTFLRTDNLPVGVRVVHHKDGWIPIGFFQMWNPKGSGINDYASENKKGYDRTDVLQAKRWSKIKRRFIPDIICVHLASEKQIQGRNWSGRKSIIFGQMNPIHKFFMIIWYYILKIFYIIYRFFEKQIKYFIDE